MFIARNWVISMCAAENNVVVNEVWWSEVVNKDELKSVENKSHKL